MASPGRQAKQASQNLSTTSALDYPWLTVCESVTVVTSETRPARHVDDSRTARGVRRAQKMVIKAKHV